MKIIKTSHGGSLASPGGKGMVNVLYSFCTFGIYSFIYILYINSEEFRQYNSPNEVVQCFGSTAYTS